MQKISKTRQEAFNLYDIKNVEERITIWKNMLPRVELFYAAKVNPNVEILKACVNN
jgi:diaminopimelate decarboxylase